MRREKKSRMHPNVLVTVGPTRAYLDSVRYLTNYSTGQLGFLICKELIRKGMRVHLVSGPCEQPFRELRLTTHHAVETASEMNDAVRKICRNKKPEFAIFAAAVLDFEPKKRKAGKVSSDLKVWKLELVPTPKIIDGVRKDFPQISCVGFKLQAKPGEVRDPKTFVAGWIKKKGLVLGCYNVLTAIRGRRHKALIMNREGKFQIASSKPQIAKAITATLKRL